MTQEPSLEQWIGAAVLPLPTVLREEADVVRWVGTGHDEAAGLPRALRRSLAGQVASNRPDDARAAVIWVAGLLALGLLGGSALLRWGTRWGSTPAERARSMPGDEYLDGGPKARVAMTRAISIEALPERVWPWIAQLGRGAGWYSVDWLDNGRKVSARHIIAWIPEPGVGDATAIGYLRHLDTGNAVAWWLASTRFAGSETRLVAFYGLEPQGRGTRLISRMSADAAGPAAQLALLVFRVIDSIMASRQLTGIRDRVESSEAHPGVVPDPETGKRDQYQLYEALYASGGSAGVAGREHAARWRRSAIEDGVLAAPSKAAGSSVDIL